jgi:hypothetical protein
LSDHLSSVGSGTWAQWAGAAATTAAVIWAVFSQGIFAWFRRPQLDFEAITKGPQDCVAVPLTIGTATVHLRFRIKNTGWSLPAHNVQVYAEQLEVEQAGMWDVVDTFPSMNLTWADLDIGILEWIPSGESRRCNLGHIVDPIERNRRPQDLDSERHPSLLGPNVSFTFATIRRPNHKGYIVGPGTYRLSVSVSAENALPVRRSIELTVRGPWYPDPHEMMAQGFDVKTGPQVPPRSTEG